MSKVVNLAQKSARGVYKPKHCFIPIHFWEAIAFATISQVCQCPMTITLQSKTTSLLHRLKQSIFCRSIPCRSGLFRTQSTSRRRKLDIQTYQPPLSIAVVFFPFLSARYGLRQLNSTLVTPVWGHLQSREIVGFWFPPGVEVLTSWCSLDPIRNFPSRVMRSRPLSYTLSWNQGSNLSLFEVFS